MEDALDISVREAGPQDADAIYERPQKEYTRNLIAAIPKGI